MKLDSPIDQIPNFKEASVRLYKRLGLNQIQDIIYYLPRYYQDFSQIVTIAQARPGRITIKAQVKSVFSRPLQRRGLHLTSVNVADETGSLRLIWFNQPYRAKSLRRGSWYYFSGTYELRYRSLQMVNPTSQAVGESAELPNLMRPIYGLTAGLKNQHVQKTLRQLQPLFSQIEEILPDWLVQEAQLLPLKTSLWQVHFSQDRQQADEARRQLDFRSLISVGINSRLLKAKLEQQRALPIPIQRPAIEQALAALPFQLTGQQAAMVEAILAELAQPYKPLNRLIQGDVGTGKTVVALLLALNVIKAGYQVALLAPTQLLARQHYETCLDTLKPLVKAAAMGLLTSDLPAAEQRSLKAKLQTGQLQLVVGTHSLLSASVKFKNLALIIIDEQHRFGVHQRLNLLHKTRPELGNVLSLSATPIPRSLALVLYADLDISSLKEKPAGRQRVETTIISLNDRERQLTAIIEAATPERQLYVVCPSISRQEGDDSVERVVEYFKKLEPDLDYRVVHGRLAAEQRQQLMTDFRDAKFSILFCTSIIGAGIDIPGAAAIVIISPDQFGLAQLHQFRGRVGRRSQRGYCYLCPFSNRPPSARLRALLQHDDGFKLSEIDLKLRGPGVLYGVQQSGPLSIFDIGLQNAQDLSQALTLAEEFIRRDHIDHHPRLRQAISQYQPVTHLN